MPVLAGRGGGSSTWPSGSSPPAEPSATGREPNRSLRGARDGRRLLRQAPCGAFGNQAAAGCGFCEALG